MHASRQSANTAHSSPSATAHAHGRSQSLSDPRVLQTNASLLQLPPSASSTSAFDCHDSSSVPEWQYASGVASISDYSSVYQDSNASVNAQPHVAPRATSPQSTVSSGSPICNSPVVPSMSTETGNPACGRTSGKKSSIDRNRKPCGACSSSKRKCKLIPGIPNLCERCRNHGLTECPPYVSWSARRANVADNGSLSPLELDEGALSSRSASPSYFGPAGPARSPSGYSPALTNQNEQIIYPHMTTQEWVQAQQQDNCAPGNSNPMEPGSYEQFYAVPHTQQPGLVHLNVPQVVQQGMQNTLSPYSSPSQPRLPVCQNCQTPYNEYLMLNYALAQLHATMPSPPYELDQAVLKMYGHVPPQDDSYHKAPF